MILYTVTGKVGQAGYLNLKDSGDLTGKNVYVNITNRCPCSCVFCLRQTKKMMEGNSLWLKGGEPSVETVMEEFFFKRGRITDAGALREVRSNLTRLLKKPQGASCTRKQDLSPAKWSFSESFRERICITFIQTATKFQTSI